MEELPSNAVPAQLELPAQVLKQSSTVVVALFLERSIRVPEYEVSISTENDTPATTGVEPSAYVVGVVVIEDEVSVTPASKSGAVPIVLVICAVLVEEESRMTVSEVSAVLVVDESREIGSGVSAVPGVVKVMESIVEDVRSVVKVTESDGCASAIDSITDVPASVVEA